MLVTDLDYNSKFDSSYFALEENVSKNIDTTVPVSKIDDIVYPMYIPVNTTLKTQDKIKTETGERVILTFDGESPFMFVQETVSIDKDLQTIPVYGEPVMIGEAVAAVNGYSINWYSNGKEYYVFSNSLKDVELLEIASSVGSIPVIK